GSRGRAAAGPRNGLDGELKVRPLLRESFEDRPSVTDRERAVTVANDYPGHAQVVSQAHWAEATERRWRTAFVRSAVGSDPQLRDLCDSPSERCGRRRALPWEAGSAKVPVRARLCVQRPPQV